MGWPKGQVQTAEHVAARAAAMRGVPRPWVRGNGGATKGRPATERQLEGLKTGWRKREPTPPGTKRCSSCREVLPLSAFHGVGTHNYCRACFVAWRKRHEYGLSIEEYEALFRSPQCAICGRGQGSVRTDLLHIDHDHVTGRVRGLLCPNCNQGIERFKDDPSRLRAAADYIEASRKEGEYDGD